MSNHPSRKNEGADDKYKAENKSRNSARGKQYFIPELSIWVRQQPVGGEPHGYGIWLDGKFHRFAGAVQDEQIFVEAL